MTVKILKTITLCLISTALLSACSGKNVDSENYPMDPDDARRAKRGKLSGEDGLVLFGKGSIFDKKGSTATGGGLGVNAYLWRATLDTISFMPITSSDPVGGVLITDWYENAESQGERYKLNVLIKDTELRADAVSVNVFKQTKDANGNWRDAPVDKKVSTDIEDAILTKARQLKIRAENS